MSEYIKGRKRGEREREREREKKIEEIDKNKRE